MPDSPRSMANMIGHMFQLLTVLLALTLLLYGDGLSFLILIIPSVILLWMTVSGHKRDDYALLVFKLAVLVQSVILWLSLMSTVWDQVDRSMLQDRYRSNSVKNTYSNPFVKEVDHTSIPRKVKVDERYPHEGGDKVGGSKGNGRDRGTKNGSAYKKVIARELKQPLALPPAGEGEVEGDKDALLQRVFGKLPSSDFDDLKFRTKNEIKSTLSTIFSELPSAGFLPGYKNPCWFKPDTAPPQLVCLPYVYMLGMPKCGTSDLYARIINHEHISPPKRKEIRWFTRGEFEFGKLPDKQRLGVDTSIYDFTAHFTGAAKEIQENPSRVITLDGNPNPKRFPMCLHLWYCGRGQCHCFHDKATSSLPPTHTNTHTRTHTHEHTHTYTHTNTYKHRWTTHTLVANAGTRWKP